MGACWEKPHASTHRKNTDDDAQEVHVRLSGLWEEARMKPTGDVDSTYEHTPLDQHVDHFLHLPLDASSLHGRERINRYRQTDTDIDRQTGGKADMKSRSGDTK